MKRRTFLALSLGSIAGASNGLAQLPFKRVHAEPAEVPFKISLAEWLLNKTLFSGKLSNLDFPAFAKREFGIDCVEYVDQFFADKAKDTAYLTDLKHRTDSEGITNHLIMLDTNGPLGAADRAARDKAVDKTLPWIDAAQFLGCKTVRVNARGEGTPDELRDRVAESCVRLADYAAERHIDIAIENHGHESSDPAWLTLVMGLVGKPNFGTLPDFGNFPPGVNRYEAVEMFMPYAKAVSAKASGFTPEGLVAETDYRRMMRIVRDGGYTGHVGIESEVGSAEAEADAVRKTRDLLLKIRDEESRRTPIFNGKDLRGWTIMYGGEWAVTNGVLIGRNGKDWSTNPEKSGSWLSTAEEYGDFRLELQYAINQGGNSGVFFRSARQKNPAFTGYEMQIMDFHGQEPSKQGATAIYDLLAPAKNLVRPAGEWNTVTITAKGPKIAFEMNGELVLESEQTRSMRGYIGLQNHDEHAEVRFRNIRIESL